MFDSPRIFAMNDVPVTHNPVIYWMSREQRVCDNWGLLYAQKLALERKKPLAVVFTLADSFLGASEQHFNFMLSGLEQIGARLFELNIPFIILPGNPPEQVCAFLAENPTGALFTDFDPLRIKRNWRDTVAAKSNVACFEVDGHNVVPCRFVSNKQEFGAYTLRPKIHKMLPEFLNDFPSLQKHPFQFTEKSSAQFFTGKFMDGANKASGEPAAQAKMFDFIENKLEKYDLFRNDPNVDGQSGLSPYLHFGQISPQRVALEVARASAGTASGDAFLEELIVRRELSDNFCWYNQRYDNTAGFPDWALKTIGEHKNDMRQFLYNLMQFEQADTHDALWNAAQMEMVTTGRMHGYMRMYWAKKILEWSESAEAAMEIAIYLNDRYQLDGRDPNGYAGIAWSIGGLHDRAWGARPIFGKIRYMNEKGCRRKFDVNLYISRFAPLK